MATCLGSGPPLQKSLELSGAGTESQKLQATVRTAVVWCDEGLTLSEALAPEAGIFPRYFLPVLRAGEAGGRLVEAFQLVHQHCRRIGPTLRVVRNTYTGQITLQVSGLTAGGTVVVQKFLDLNTNGVIDNGDLLVQQFSLTDGQAGMAFGGVTNFNVPGDTDGAANGHIAAKLNFQGGDLLQNVVGKYLFKVSGNFTPPITNSFTVTNFPWGQKFTGNVVSNGVAVPNAVVLLFVPDKSPIAGTSNCSGRNFA